MAMIGGTGRVGFFIKHAEINFPYKLSDIRALFKSVVSDDNEWGEITPEQSKALMVNLYRSSCYDTSLVSSPSRTIILHNRTINNKHDKAEAITKEMCMYEASKYSFRSDWDKADSRTYGAAAKRGWLEDCCEHMLMKHHLSHHNKETCIKSALKFKSRASWSRGDRKRYYSARRYGWLDECCVHMKPAKVGRPKKQKAITP